MRIRPGDRDIRQLATRVLAQVMAGEKTSRRDVIILRRNAPAAASDLPVPKLCRVLLQQEDSNWKRPSQRRIE